MPADDQPDHAGIGPAEFEHQKIALAGQMRADADRVRRRDGAVPEKERRGPADDLRRAPTVRTDLRAATATGSRFAWNASTDQDS
jgi:hypothetical protein